MKSERFSAQLFLGCFLEHQIRMISEGSCDTADWNNDADNSALPSQE